MNQTEKQQLELLRQAVAKNLEQSSDQVEPAHSKQTSATKTILKQTDPRDAVTSIATATTTLKNNTQQDQGDASTVSKAQTTTDQSFYATIATDYSAPDATTQHSASQQQTFQDYNSQQSSVPELSNQSAVAKQRGDADVSLLAKLTNQRDQLEVDLELDSGYYHAFTTAEPAQKTTIEQEAQTIAAQLNNPQLQKLWQQYQEKLGHSNQDQNHPLVQEFTALMQPTFLDQCIINFFKYGKYLAYLLIVVQLWDIFLVCYDVVSPLLATTTTTRVVITTPALNNPLWEVFTSILWLSGYWLLLKSLRKEHHKLQQLRSRQANYLWYRLKQYEETTSRARATSNLTQATNTGVTATSDQTTTYADMPASDRSVTDEQIFTPQTAFARTITPSYQESEHRTNSTQEASCTIKNGNSASNNGSNFDTNDATSFNLNNWHRNSNANFYFFGKQQSFAASVANPATSSSTSTTTHAHTTENNLATPDLSAETLSYLKEQLRPYLQSQDLIGLAPVTTVEQALTTILRMQQQLQTTPAIQAKFIDWYRNVVDPSYSEYKKPEYLLFEYEKLILTEQDKLAQQLIYNFASQNAVATSLSPFATIDMLIMFNRCLALLDRLTQLYGIELNYLQRIKFIKQIFNLTLIAGASEAVSDMSIEILTSGIVTTLSKKAGQGLLMGLLTARLGFKVVEVLRPLQTPSRVPSISQMLKALTQQLSTSATGDQAPKK